MTWLYVPTTFLPSVPGLEGSTSESPSPCTVGERLHAASATWRGKPQPPQAWSRRWKQGGFIQRLSGPTFSPSMLDAGVASFISSLRETPARTTASPAKALDLMENASWLPRSAASPTSAGLILSSERTCRGTRTDSLRPSSRHWSDWATALRQEYSARPKPETPCGASDCSSWPSASVMDTGDNTDLEKIQARREKHKARSINGNGFGMSLAEEARRWAGPKVLQGGANSNRLARGAGGPDLQEQAKTWNAPLVADAGEKVTLASHQDSLLAQADRFRPPSSPARPIAVGSMSSTAGPNSNQPSARRKLNPIFVEALMRWPTGLSGFERQETAWTRWWLLMPSFVSTLCSPKPERQASLF